MVVFDMAGTTVNEDNLVYKTLRKAINEAGFNFTLEEVLEHGAGKEKKQAIIDTVGTVEALADERAEAIFTNFKAMLKVAYAETEVGTYAGVEDLLKELRAQQVKVVLNTGYDLHTASTLIGKLGWKKDEHFDMLITATDVANGRPAPDMIHLAMKTLGVADASKVVKVGDSIIDVEEGKNAGCGMSVGVTTGAHSRAQLQTAAPEAIIDELAQIKSFVL